MKLGWVIGNLVFGLCLIAPSFALGATDGKQDVDPTAPIVHYHFSLGGEFAGGEDIWINQVYLGKMPFTMTREEFKAKVPFLEDPPPSDTDENASPSDGRWFKFQLVVLLPSRNGLGPYRAKHRTYYARVKLHDEWGRQGRGGCGGGGDDYRHNYHVSIWARFPSREKRIAAKAQRLETLLHTARLADYQVDSEWRSALLSHAESGWMTLLQAAGREKGFDELVCRWIRDEYKINRDDPKSIFERICKEADAQASYHTGSHQALAIAMIYDKLDFRPLISTYEKAIKSRRPLNSGYGRRELAQKTFIEYDHRPSEPQAGDVWPASLSVTRHVLQLWDQKLDAETADPDNPIEKRITPALLIHRHALELSSEFGGSTYEQYLLRHFRREQRVEGMALGPENYEYKVGLCLNKWLYHLVRLDTPVGRSFRRRHAAATTEMARLLLSSRHDHRKAPPEFLFLDLDRGRSSLSFTFWPDYLPIAQDASGWEHDKLKLRLAYLARLGDLATEAMYRECWQQVDLKRLNQTDMFVQILDVVPARQKLFMARHILDDIQNREVVNKVIAIRTLTFLLAQCGDEPAVREFHDMTASRPYEDYVKPFVDSDLALNHPFIKVLARHNNPNMRKAILPLIRKYLIPEYRELLNGLLSDADPNVKRLAHETFAELDRISKLPPAALVAYPSGAEHD
jgi:hypothetical protein